MVDFEGCRQSVPVSRPGASGGQKRSGCRRRDKEEDEESGAPLPDGWVKKALPGREGKAVFVHLKSGNTVERLQSLVSATKRSRPAADAAIAKRGTILDRILPDRCHRWERLLKSVLRA